MKHLEYFNHWYDRLLNTFPFCLDDSQIKTIGIAWIFRENNHWNLTPRITGNAQYYNAMFFVRIGFPFALFFMFRWSAIGKHQFIQAGIGWKQTGRFAVHCRVQTDANAAIGYHAGLSNTDQAIAWNYGKH